MKKLFIYIILALITFECKEKYLPAITSPATGYLVVEGFINSGLQPTSISLTRTTRLFDTANIIYEHNAIINIEGDNQETYPLYDNGNGNYISASSLSLNSNQNYRLHIRTQDGIEYLSDFSKVKNTPQIDSITWVRENGGVRLYINTHDPQNATRYYQWKYKEVWEIHSAYLTNLVYGGPLDKPFVEYRFPNGAYDFSIYKCWSQDTSKRVILGTSEKLTADKIYFPLLLIPSASERLSVLYSINISQYALSREAYLFLDKIKKNTEQLGSIFDPQPSELQGNIHCVNNPSEIVVGHVEVSEPKELRLFISKSQVPGWNYRSSCDFKVLVNHPDSIISGGRYPTVPQEVNSGVITKFGAVSTLDCIDCTLKGTNIKPAYWP